MAVVCVPEEHRLAAVSGLSDVMGNSEHGEAGNSDHTVTLSQNSLLVK